MAKVEDADSRVSVHGVDDVTSALVTELAMREVDLSDLVGVQDEAV